VIFVFASESVEVVYLIWRYMSIRVGVWMNGMNVMNMTLVGFE